MSQDRFPPGTYVKATYFGTVCIVESTDNGVCRVRIVSHGPDYGSTTMFAERELQKIEPEDKPEPQYILGSNNVDVLTINTATCHSCPFYDAEYLHCECPSNRGEMPFFSAGKKCPLLSKSVLVVAKKKQ